MNISFDRGSLVIELKECSSEVDSLIGHLVEHDRRTGQCRSLAIHYGEMVLALFRAKISYVDHAKQFGPLSLSLSGERSARPYQGQALNAWITNRKRGCVTLPTGSGKSFLAMLAMERVQRNTLVIVPTLDLVNQWKSDLERSFGIEVGVWGGGERSTEFVTVSTYDSAHLYMELEGNRFGFLIFDECHHLPGPSYQWIAKMSIAPYRLGLSATPERQDGGEQLLEELIGPMSFRIDIQDLKGHYLSDYETELIEVPLSREELEAYQGYRKVYTEFLHAQKIDFSHASAWTDFLNICFKSEQGRVAYDAYRKQKEIIRRSDSKLRKLWDLLFEYREEQIIIFTNDNETAYHIGELFILPVLTHHTKLAERKRILDGFRSGRWPWLVTSKVLNEGVDVPQVNVGIIVSGSGSVREHVQRLGRLLRKHGHEKAKLIELISQGTAESYQSQRRRSHSAYRNS